MHEIKYAAAKEGFYKAKRILENVETGEFPGTYSRWQRTSKIPPILLDLTYLPSNPNNKPKSLNSAWSASSGIVPSIIKFNHTHTHTLPLLYSPFFLISRIVAGKNFDANNLERKKRGILRLIRSKQLNIWFMVFWIRRPMRLLEILHEGVSDNKIARLLTLLQSIFSFIFK